MCFLLVRALRKALALVLALVPALFLQTVCSPQCSYVEKWAAEWVSDSASPQVSCGIWDPEENRMGLQRSWFLTMERDLGIYVLNQAAE